MFFVERSLSACPYCFLLLYCLWGWGKNIKRKVGYGFNFPTKTKSLLPPSAVVLSFSILLFFYFGSLSLHMWQLHYSNNFSKKRGIFVFLFEILKFISLRATLCTEPVLGQVIVETTKKKSSIPSVVQRLRPTSSTDPIGSPTKKKCTDPPP